jgi:hypothetical protein
MATTLQFTSWQRSGLFDLAQKQGARLASKVPLVLTDTNTGQQATGEAPFQLLAAADIAGLKPGAIKHHAPAPFARDAETTKLVHVDFWEKDLPWRYTPEAAAAGQVRPWLVLLVGTGEEIQVAGGLANVKDTVLKDHDLAQSHAWAHVQDDGSHVISRLLSPRHLLPQREYVAVLVPAFNAAGNPMWKASGEADFGPKGVLPAFHFWRFWTAEAGDFETLAAALRIPPASNVGKARLLYRRQVPADGVDINENLEVRGAITSLQAVDEPSAAVQAVRVDLDVLNNALENTIGLPHYGRPWLPQPDDIAAGWPADLNDDPRFRGLTGLGTWMGVEAQEALMDAAVQQAGALREAGQRLGHLALGLWTAGRLWDRRLPADKMERLRILGPLMGRMLAADGGLVLDRVTGASSPLDAALFSSAAQRLLRNRSPHTRHLAGANGGLSAAAALAAANQAEPLPERAPAGLPHFDTIAREMGLPPLEELFQLDNAWLDEVLDQVQQLLRELRDEYRRRRDELLQNGQEQLIPEMRFRFAEEVLTPQLADYLQQRMAERQLPCEGWGMLLKITRDLPGGLVDYFARVLEEDGAQERFLEALVRELRLCMGARPCRERIEQSPLFNDLGDSFCEDMLGTLTTPPRTEQQPIHLDNLSDALYGALDPRQATAPARLRLCSQIRGIDCTRLTRPEFPIGLDFPTWDLLRKYDKEWLLPGASTLPKDSITALQTNPVFIDAYMLGINTQFMSEMRWRDLAVARTCTPLRMFWGQVNYATQKRQADIEPIAEWAKVPADPIGALTHQTLQPHDAGNTTGSRLVIAFRSDLFRRYPATLVYLVRPPAGATVAQVDALLTATPQLDMPAGEANTEQWRRDRVYFGPTFAGTITPELTFFAFDVTPEQLDQYWLVLDEPPAELRFRSDKIPNATNSAAFAKSTLDQPTRVAISGDELKKKGMTP